MFLFCDFRGEPNPSFYFDPGEPNPSFCRWTKSRWSKSIVFVLQVNQIQVKPATPMTHFFPKRVRPKFCSIYFTVVFLSLTSSAAALFDRETTLWNDINRNTMFGDPLEAQVLFYVQSSTLLILNFKVRTHSLNLIWTKRSQYPLICCFVPLNEVTVLLFSSIYLSTYFVEIFTFSIFLVLKS